MSNQTAWLGVIEADDVAGFGAFGQQPNSMSEFLSSNDRY